MFYSADWIDGGGVDNLGTGNGVYVKTYDAAGRVLNHVAVAPRRSGGPSSRLAAHRAARVAEIHRGSTDATLEYAMFDPVTAKLDKLGTLNDAIQYYVYSSAYVPEIDRFIVVTTTADDRARRDADRAGRAHGDSTACRRRCANPASGVGHACVRTDPRRAAADTVARTGGHFGERRAAFADSVGFDRYRRLPGSGTAMHFVSLTPSGTREADFEPARETPMPKSAVPCSSH